ncbi:MAG: hypothetical protein JSV18_07645 [Candidatus Bathyarchaeota archaeon]|nr:MAG: hypothetical protein JSV18_07645 [Candidatus Bathyarchaeota archaeon]
MEAKRAIGASRPVNRIFSKQKPGGFWESEAQPYKPKYKSTYWQLMILGMLGLDRSDERVRRAVDYIWRFQHEDGGFCSEKEEGAHIEYVKVGERLARKGKSLPPFEEWAPGAIRESEMTCLTGNVCAALIRMGYADDRRVRKALDWLVEVQNRDGGWLCPYWRAHIRDKHGCFMGTITPLDAFTEFPERLRTLEMSEAVSRGAKFLLMHRLYKADHHGFRIINDSWLSLGFPRFGYDILRGLDVVTRLDYSRDERINDALDVLLRRRDPDGRWILDHTPSGRMQTNLEQKGRPSKWVTLNALRVLKRVYQSKSAYITGLFGLPHESQYD